MISETGPGDYRIGLGATPPDLDLVLVETIATKDAHGEYTSDPLHLSIYAYEDVLLGDLPSIPISAAAGEAITIIEFLRILTIRNLTKFEQISVDDFGYGRVPGILELQAFERIAVVDRTPTARANPLVIHMAETITVQEGGLNPGVSSSGSMVLGPAPAPEQLPDDYWIVGI